MQKVDKSKYSFVYSILAVTLIVAVWWTMAETTFKKNGIVPTPWQTLKIIGQEMQKDSFFRAIFSTLWRSFYSFFISFFVAGLLAILAYFNKNIYKAINPFIVLCRSMPTMALVLILMLTVGSDNLPTVVAFLVVFPLCFQNLSTAINQTDKNLITMAKVFGVSKWQQITSIYIPTMLPFIFSSIIAGFGLNIKVVISAEVMGLPSMSIGYLILAAKQGFKFGVAFAWLVIAVVVSLICESVLKVVGRLCMPYKYSDMNKIKKFFGVFSVKGSKK